MPDLQTPSNAPAGWGAGSVMTDFEATMWRAEADPRLRSTGVVLEVLDRVPDWRRLVDAHRWGLTLVPRLGHRVVEDPLHLGAPVWTPDTNVDLAYHLRRVSAPPPGTQREVLAIAETFAMTPLDTARPLWEALLIEGLADGSAAYLLKLHHCLTDGQAMVQLFDLLHSTSAEPSGHPVPGPVSQSTTAPSPTQARAADLWQQAGSTVDAATGLLRHAISHPRAAAGSAVQWSRSLARVAGSAPAPPSPLLADRGLPRRFGSIALPFADLRAASKAVDASVNDVFLAAVTGGLRSYHEALGVSVDEVTLAFPVSLRNDRDPLGGNRFSGARIAAPLGVIDPAKRVATIRERVLGVRDEPALDFMSAIAPLLARMPGPALTRLTASVTGSIDLQASNIPGLTRPAYIAGARITRMFPFGPAPGPPIMVTLISHDGTCCIGITMDAVAVTDPPALVEAMRRGFDEILGLAGASVPAGEVLCGSGEPAGAGSGPDGSGSDGSGSSSGGSGSGSVGGDRAV